MWGRDTISLVVERGSVMTSVSDLTPCIDFCKTRGQRELRVVTDRVVHGGQ